MADDVLLNKASVIERCLQRIAEDYANHEHELETDYTRQDAIVLNLLRACEAAIDMAMHVVRKRGLGLPQESRDAFKILEQAGVLPAELSVRMQRMVGFRNVAVHEYRKMSLEILRGILESRLDDFRRLIAVSLKRLPEAKQ